MIGENRFFEIMDSFRRLKMSSLLPGITHAEYGIMHTIHCVQEKTKNKQVTVSEIVRAMHVAAPAVSRCLNGLEQKNYIVRTTNPIDRRNIYLELTVTGQEVLTEAEACMSAFFGAVIHKMGEENMRQLCSYMEQLLLITREEIETRQYKKKGLAKKNG